MSFPQSMNNFVFHCIKHIRFHAKQRVLVGNFTALLYQKKSAAEAHRIFLRLMATMLCWKQHVGIGLDTSKMMILMLKIKNTLVHQKVWRRRIGGISSWRLTSGTSWTCKIIRGWTHNSFNLSESIKNDSKARTLGAVRVEVERHWMASFHL